MRGPPLTVLPWLLLSLACQDPVGPPIDLETRLARIFEDSARANGVIGAQAVVRLADGSIWSAAYGEERPGVPMAADRLIGTGSISKLYTAVAAMLLIDRGAFALDDTVGRWFPGLTNVPGSITVRQMLRQTSGLADYMQHPDYSATVFADPSRAWSPEELLAFVEPPRFAPDQAWEASNTNRLLLGIIVERETGMSLGEFMRQELFAPPQHFWLSGDGNPPSNLATQWFVDRDGNRLDATGTLFGPALYTSRIEVQASAEGNAAFGARLLDGDLLSETMREAMLTIVPDDGAIANQTGGGFAIRRYSYFGRTMYGHSGGTPNSSAMVLYDPVARVTVAVSVNQDGVSHRQSHFATAAALIQAAFTEPGS